MDTQRRSYFKWTITELLALQREFELLGLSVEEIAEKHGRSDMAICMRLQQEGMINDFSEYVKAKGYDQFVKDESVPAKKGVSMKKTATPLLAKNSASMKKTAAPVVTKKCASPMRLRKTIVKPSIEFLEADLSDDDCFSDTDSDYSPQEYVFKSRRALSNKSKPVLRESGMRLRDGTCYQQSINC